MYVCVYTDNHMYICIYIYIHTEKRKRKILTCSFFLRFRVGRQSRFNVLASTVKVQLESLSPGGNQAAIPTSFPVHRCKVG